MRLLLIKLSETIDGSMQQTYTPPIGLWNIRRVAISHGDTCCVVDQHMGQRLPIEEDFDVIGLSVQFSTQHDEYVRMAYACSELWPDAKIVAGGFHAAAVEKPRFVDEVCFGAGEKFFYNVVPILYPEFKDEEMDPYWERASPHGLHPQRYKWMPIETSRGCSRHCHYCGVNRFWGPWEKMASICGYLKMLEDRGIKELRIVDDHIFSIEEHTKKILPYLNRFKWSTPNGVNIRRAMRYIDELSGCWSLSLPFETGTKSTAKLMGIGNKFIGWAEAYGMVSELNSRGIKTTGFFIIGYPGETLIDIQATLDYANSLPLDNRWICIATPYPGTQLYEMCVEKGYLDYKPGPDLYRRLDFRHGVISTELWTSNEVSALHKQDRDAAIRRKNDST